MDLNKRGEIARMSSLIIKVSIWGIVGVIALWLIGLLAAAAYWLL